MRFLVLVNPRSGSRAGRDLVRRVHRRLKASRHPSVWESPAGPGELRGRILSARADGFDAVLLAGGDGTLHAAWTALRAAGLPLGVIAAGRGNDFVRSLHEKGGSITRWDFESDPRVREVDLPEVNGVPFGSVACLGFDASVNRLARDGCGRLPGSLGYSVCVLLALRDLEAFRVRLSLDGRAREESVVMATVANGRFYGGGMRIAPAASMDDGLLDVCVVRAIGRVELARQFPRVYRGSHLSHPRVWSATARRVEIMAEGTREIFADGEPVGSTPLRCEVGDVRLRVLSFGGEPAPREGGG